MSLYQVTAGTIDFPSVSLTLDEWQRRSKTTTTGQLERAIERWREGASDLERRIFDHHRAESVTLPVVPALADHLVASLTGSAFSTESRTELFELDPVLSVALIRCASTSAFFRGREALDVREAITRMGPAGASYLALSLATTSIYDQSVRQAMMFVGHAYAQEHARAMLLAQVAHEIAVDQGHDKPNFVLTGALFHSVGHLLAIYAIGDMARNDAEVAALTEAEVLKVAARLSGVMKGDFILRSCPTEALAELCLEVDAPLHVPVSATALIIRLALGAVKLSHEPRAKATVKALDLTTRTQGRLQRAIERGRGQARAVISRLSRPAAKRTSAATPRATTKDWAPATDGTGPTPLLSVWI